MTAAVLLKRPTLSHGDAGGTRSYFQIGCGRSATSLMLVGQLQDSPKPGLVKPIAKLAHERRKAGLAGAVAWRDPLESKCVVQHVYDSLDLFT